MKTWVHTDKAFMESVIRQSPICFVGLADTDGTPYVLPMNFGYHEGVIYLHSAQQGRSISILERNPRVCVAFSIDNTLVYQHPDVACSYRMRSKSVIAWGKVAFVDNAEGKVEAKHAIARGMKADGMPVEAIAKYTGLSAKEIENL